MNLKTNVIKRTYCVRIAGPDGIYARKTKAESQEAARLWAEDLAAGLAQAGTGAYVVLSVAEGEGVKE